MITGPQLRAARGLLDWTRGDLAKAAQISAETVKNIEHGTFRPQETTAQRIVETFAAHDVEFTEDQGVRLRRDAVTRYEGVDGFKKFLDNVYETAQHPSSLKEGDKPFYMSSLDDRYFIKYLGDFFTMHIKRMNALKDKFKMFILIKEKPHSLQPGELQQGSYREYRTLPATMMGNVPFYVYGNNLAILIFEDNKSPQIVVIHSPLVARAYREQFDLLWKAGKPLKESGSKRGAE